MSDTVKSWIEERRAVHAKGSSGRWDCNERNWDEPYGMTLVYDVFHNGETMDRDHVADAAYDNAEVIVDAHNTFPRALDALNAVLELHVKETGGTPTGDVADVCSCGMHYWPCPTVQAIEGAISE